MRPYLRVLGSTALAATMTLLPSSGRSVEYLVPSFGTPTLQDAVDDAAASAAVDDIITITSSPISTGAAVVFGDDFDVDNQVLVRPSPALGRATIHSFGSAAPIIHMEPGPDGGSHVTLQDLDLLRRGSGSNSHLVSICAYRNVTIERCRIGLDWTTPGPSGWSNVYISYPYEIVIRNCILFSLFPGNFDRAIEATQFNDPANSLYLYNNVMADYRFAGIRITDDVGMPGSFAVLRNNVAVGHPGIDPDDVVAGPFGYVSLVDGATTILTSHNTAFVAPGEEEFLFGASRPIAGDPDAGFDTTFLTFTRPTVDPSFVDWQWTLTPPVDANDNFFRLEPFGPLHDDEPDDWGANVTDVEPDADDIAVVDDIEGDPRPSGTTSHTDRGADQIAVLASAAPMPVGQDGLLLVAPRRNPARSAEIAYQVASAGRLVFELFDIAGRQLHRTERAVNAGETGVFVWTEARTSGVLAYRVTLTSDTGSGAQASGQMVVIR